jgi:hypothetical protein
VGNTEDAIGAYLEKAERSGETARTGGSRDYLGVYGVLQALVVQQDAVRAVARGAGFSTGGVDPRLQEIRNIRNLSVGHPTRAAKHPGKPSSFIVQISMSPSGFKLLSLFDDGSQEVRTIDLLARIAEQRIMMAETINEARNRLQDKDREHRRKYRSLMLTDTLSDVRYHMGKVYDLIHSKEGRRHAAELGALHLPSIVKSLKKAESDLRKRGDFESYEATLAPSLEVAHHCAERLSAYFDGSYSPDNAHLDAEAFYRALSGIVDDFKSLLQDVDEEYRDES